MARCGNQTATLGGPLTAGTAARHPAIKKGDLAGRSKRRNPCNSRCYEAAPPPRRHPAIGASRSALAERVKPKRS
jgi:hypothetical protein